MPNVATYRRPTMVSSKRRTRGPSHFFWTLLLVLLLRQHQNRGQVPLRNLTKEKEHTLWRMHLRLLGSGGGTTTRWQKRPLGTRAFLHSVRKLMQEPIILFACMIVLAYKRGPSRLQTRTFSILSIYLVLNYQSWKSSSNLYSLVQQGSTRCMVIQ